MRLGILSDTHGSIEATRQAVRMFESLEVEHLLHCGDIGIPEVIALLRPWPAHYVFGNCDYDHAPLREAILAGGQVCCDEFGAMQLEGVPIALLHSHDRARFDEVTTSGKYRLVCYGHTHRAALQRQDETLVLNPGALHRADPYSIAVVDLPRMEATIVEL